MAEKKPSGFRFRLPWLLQPSLASRTAGAPDPPTPPPRTTAQTSVSSSSNQRPPFRPPGKAPASPIRSTVSVVAKSPDSVATLPAKETQTITKNIPTEETQAVTKTIPTKETQSVTKNIPTEETQTVKKTIPTKETQTVTKTIPTKETQNIQTEETQTVTKPIPSEETQTVTKRVPTEETQTVTKPIPTAETQTVTKTIPTEETQSVTTIPTKETQTVTKIIPTKETANLTTKTKLVSKTDLETSSPKTETSPAISKVVDTIETQPTKENRTTDETIPTVKTLSPKTQPQTPPNPPPKASSPPRSPLLTRKLDNISEIKRSTETKSMETKSHKTKPTTSASSRVPFHREIKDDISKFIRNITTSALKQYSDEKQASFVTTIAGDNKGAFMHLLLHSDGKKSEITETDSTKTGEIQETKAMINSNVQGINNSLMLNTSVKEKNPGVHVVLSRDKTKTDDSKIDKMDSMDVHRAEAEVSSPETVVYDPEYGSSSVFMDPNEFDEDEIEVI